MKKIAVLLFGAWTMAALTAAAETALERIKREGVARLGVANEAPYGYVTAEGKLTGEAPSIARKILAKIDPGVTVDGVVTEFGSLIEELRSGRFDIIAAGMFVTPERCEEIAFSDPTYKIGEALLVRAGNPKSLSDFESIAKNADARLAVMAGAVEYGYAYEAGVFVDQVSVYPDYQEALTDLKAGHIDAIAMTSLTVRALVENSGDADLEATSQFFPNINGVPLAGYGAFGFRKEDQQLLAAFNEQLKSFIGSEEYWETVTPFGFAKNDMLPDKTAAELCRE